MWKFFGVGLLCAAGLFFLVNFAFAQDKVEIIFFSSATCPHCAEERKFLDGLKNRYPEVEIKEYEVVYHPENVKILKEFYDKYDIPNNEKGLVPLTFTPTKHFIGFNEQTAKEIEGCIRQCLNNDTQDGQKIKIPILGEIDVKNVSLPLLTLVLGTLDGFNPCAMWILLVLITMLLTLRSRRKIILVGGIFILAEGLLYFVFMAAWLNFFKALSFVSLIRIGIGIFGIVFGVLRIRDFINWKPGVCKVVDDSGKGKLFDKINKVLKPAALPATILGVVSLAFGVNLVEFVCSAGFPVIYTQILVSQGLGTLQYYLYLGLYNIFYMLDDLIVFTVALITLNRFGFSDKYSRWSTLVAGLLILILGILLIFKPGLLMFG